MTTITIGDFGPREFLDGSFSRGVGETTADFSFVRTFAPGPVSGWLKVAGSIPPVMAGTSFIECHADGVLISRYAARWGVESWTADAFTLRLERVEDCD